VNNIEVKAWAPPSCFFSNCVRKVERMYWAGEKRVPQYYAACKRQRAAPCKKGTARYPVLYY